MDSPPGGCNENVGQSNGLTDFAARRGRPFSELRTAQEESKTRSSAATEQLATRAIRGKRVRIIYLLGEGVIATKISTVLSDLGALVELLAFSRNPVEEYSRKLYYLPGEREAAEQIRVALANIIELTIEVDDDPVEEGEVVPEIFIWTF